MMAKVMDEGHVRVEVADADDASAALARALRDVGFSLEELQHQAEEDDFASDRARRLWFMISPLAD